MERARFLSFPIISADSIQSFFVFRAMFVSAGLSVYVFGQGFSMGEQRPIPA
jgi:hypothetical protein